MIVLDLLSQGRLSPQRVCRVLPIPHARANCSERFVPWWRASCASRLSSNPMRDLCSPRSASPAESNRIEPDRTGIEPAPDRMKPGAGFQGRGFAAPGAKKKQGSRWSIAYQCVCHRAPARPITSKRFPRTEKKTLSCCGRSPRPTCERGYHRAPAAHRGGRVRDAGLRGALQHG